jgi:hypothetical protein
MADPIAIDGRVPIFLAKAPINGIDAPCSNVLVELRKIKSAYVNPGLYLSYIYIINDYIEEEEKVWYCDMKSLFWSLPKHLLLEESIMHYKLEDPFECL